RPVDPVVSSEHHAVGVVVARCLWPRRSFRRRGTLFTQNTHTGSRTMKLTRRFTLLGLALVAAWPAFAQNRSQPELLRIGFQKSARLVALQKTQGRLEKRRAPLGVQLKWVEFPAGPQLLEGLNVGAIDVGFVGEAPPIFAQAAGAKFVYIGYDPAAPEAEAL